FLGKFRKNKYFQVILLSVVVPFLGMLFLRGEKGVIYAYYFTGYYLFWILFFSLLLSFIFNFSWGKVLVFLFLILFLYCNFYLIWRYFNYNYRRYNPITLEDQLKAIDWIYKDAGDCNFNIDVYVPPVIPYAYDYLIKWYGNSNYGCLPKDEQVKKLYTLSEDDDSHPERLLNWRNRQDKIGRVETEVVFDKIKVERRMRI
ncbi:MAG: hypothetical protein ACPLXL_01500, partial [Minisyncoccia bacterium]